ncbi:FAD/FMN-containing dehydrogenase [Actinomadura pelletieri DSM 43383]|uniref:FAD/FMN-containing dehydrogenase n=1 Tax=Actinomadura pelletieri DSM 43383 TaxID=1120940 RepID=A0A495QHA2_9ACTN|nr:FAD-binding oxidoreductase [Actinomadura pelletieri]RKS71245.1 FAD/FMN-containing dehydrogenase [Actinomadura pelletieri DSM 43383]
MNTSTASRTRDLHVIEATGTADVRAAILTARDRGVPLTVQATGHGTLVPPDEGVLLKTSRMARVLVDPSRGTARVGPGARWSDVLAAAAPLGLSPLSGSHASVGVTGYTLGGGVGWLARRYGFAADHLLRATVVTAEGRTVTADAHENADLFWALRGGGGNFGVVTSLEFRLHPVSTVFAGTAVYPASRAGEVLTRFRDEAETRPDALSVTVAVTNHAEHGRVVIVRGVHAGDADEGARALRSLWNAGGPPLQHDFRTMPYAETESLGGTPPHHFHLFADLPDALITAIARSDAAGIEVRHWGGAMARPAPDSGPVGHRDVPFSITIDGSTADAAPLAAHSTGGSFLNFLHDTSRTATAYTPENHRRLREIKRTYDPQNVFHHNHNIRPA